MKNEIALVTGASNGIGAATAQLLGKMGYFVCVHYFKDAGSARDVVNKILQAGGRAARFQADMRSEKGIDKLFKRIDKHCGTVTALVNSAGDNGGFLACEEISTDTLMSVFSLNVFGVFICIREAARRMKKIRRGSIVNISSESAVFGGNRLTHYAASKAAVNTATRGFARELAPFNIRVNAVSPGIINTDAHRNISMKRREMIKKSLPMGRMGEAGEVAKTIAWLLSDDASYVSGSIIPVSGAR
jgi:NAD(P)-dependent dehydrogenase (short-subunit alcohol dehydrogenase family)